MVIITPAWLIIVPGSVTRTQVHQLDAAQDQFGVNIPANHVPPGHTVCGFWDSCTL